MSDEQKTQEELEAEKKRLEEEAEAAKKAEEEAKAKEKAEAGGKEEDPVEKLVEERLAKMKSNMDRMARERDEALKIVAEKEAKEKEEKMKRLEEEGKVQELNEMKLADLNARLALIQEENTKLKRDNVLNTALATLDFRNDRSRDMAYRDIVSELEQDDSGAWKHKSGVSIQDYVKNYYANEENTFLFKQQASSGTGTGRPAGTPPEKRKKASEMTSAELIEAARSGKLGNFNI